MKLKHYSGFRAYGTEELIMGIIDVDHRDYCKGPLLHSPLTTAGFGSRCIIPRSKTWLRDGKSKV